ncbi:hypothetical protein [Streptomyces sp. NPDC048425]
MERSLWLVARLLPCVLSIITGHSPLDWAATAAGQLDFRGRYP